MKKLLLVLAFLGVAVPAIAVVTITLTDHRGLIVALDPIGQCGAAGDCVFMVTVSGVATGGGFERSETLQFRSDNPAYSLNQTAVTNFFRRSRRAWKNQALQENTD